MSTINMSLHLKNFNDKVKLMNQSGKQNLTLTAQEARSLHSDVFDLLNHLATISKQLNASTSTESVIQVAVDGGGFK
jgi:hypothetical protein